MTTHKIVLIMKCSPISLAFNDLKDYLYIQPRQHHLHLVEY